MADGICARPGCNNPVRPPARGSGRTYAWCPSCSREQTRIRESNPLTSRSNNGNRGGPGANIKNWGVEYDPVTGREMRTCNCGHKFSSRMSRCPRHLLDSNGHYMEDITWQALKDMVIYEDGPWCAYCGDPYITADHVRPRANRGDGNGNGSDDVTNLVPVCGPCNNGTNGKHFKTLLEWELIAPEKVAHGIICSDKVAAEYARLVERMAV